MGIVSSARQRFRGFFNRNSIKWVYLFGSKPLMKRHALLAQAEKRMQEAPNEYSAFVHRCARWHHLNRMYRDYASEIVASAQLGRVRFPHPCGVIIGGEATLEDGVVVHQNVTIGALRFDENGRGIPCRQTVGENTIIGAGAAILGDVTIGRNCIVGANAVVTCDVPDDSVVVGHNEIHPRSDTGA